MSEADQNVRPQQVIPNPDPSSATQSSITDVKDQLRREAESMLALINARLTGIETAATKFEANLQRVPTDTQKEVGNLKELIGANLQALRDQFDQSDKRYTLVSSDSKQAVADALAAQQKSTSDAFDAQQKLVDKQDIFTKNAIDALGVLLSQTASSQGQQLNDLKDRVGRTETAVQGSITASAAKNTTAGQITAYIVAAVAVLSLVLTTLFSVLSHASTVVTK